MGRDKLTDDELDEEENHVDDEKEDDAGRAVHGGCMR